MNLARDTKGFYKYVAAKRRQGNWGLLLNGPGDLVTKAIDMALELLSACFALALVGKICLQLR